MYVVFRLCARLESVVDVWILGLAGFFASRDSLHDAVESFKVRCKR